MPHLRIGNSVIVRKELRDDQYFGKIIDKIEKGENMKRYECLKSVLRLSSG